MAKPSRWTAEKRRLIEEIKEAHPEYRHRRIQGVLQSQGVYLSVSAVYEYLRQRGWVEVYEEIDHRQKIPPHSTHQELRPVTSHMIDGCAVEATALRGQAEKPHSQLIGARE